jgi:pimeloyl-ACP methyl ester carboxylesterase
MPDAGDIVATLEARATVHRTACGTGQMVWHRWPCLAGGRARPVILLHGGSGSWTHWVKTVPALRRHYEVWAAGLPGLGDSAMPAKPHTPASSAAAVAHGIRALVSAERRPHLVGFSFGAHVGTITAASLGGHIASLMLVGSAALGLPRRILSYPKERPSMTEAERGEVHRRTLEILMFHDPSRIDDLAICIRAANVRRSRFRSRPFATTDEIRRTLPALQVPVNAIWAEHDMTAELGAEACYAVIREHHPELAARTIAGAGHWVMYEAAAAFNAALIELLEQRET